MEHGKHHARRQVAGGRPHRRGVLQRRHRDRPAGHVDCLPQPARSWCERGAACQGRKGVCQACLMGHRSNAAIIISFAASPTGGHRCSHRSIMRTQIERWVKSDSGWILQHAITRHSSNDNVRPFVLRGHAPGSTSVAWLRVWKYDSYTSYNMSVMWSYRHAG